MKKNRKRKFDFKSKINKFKYNTKEFFKKNWLEVLILLIAIFLGCGYAHNVTKPYKVTKDFSKIDLSDVDNLMIVAHPDDELLWGGLHLIEDDYLVVCITCGPNKVRVNEFTRVLDETNDKYIMLGYPDKTNGERDNWDSSRAGIEEDLRQIVALKDWNIIVTHNPQGEYGHQHHKMTNQITTKVVEDKDKLYYFGRYHSKAKMTQYIDDMTSNDDNIKKKKQLLGYYTSQKFIQTSFNHMTEYEEWESYYKWEGVVK